MVRVWSAEWPAESLSCESNRETGCVCSGVPFVFARSAKNKGICNQYEVFGATTPVHDCGGHPSWRVGAHALGAARSMPSRMNAASSIALAQEKLTQGVSSRKERSAMKDTNPS